MLAVERLKSSKNYTTKAKIPEHDDPGVAGPARGGSLHLRRNAGNRRFATVTSAARHIQKLIDDSERADEIQEIITDLYYGAKPLQTRW